MRKLSKLKLQEFREMSDFEMKHVLGGSGSFDDGGTGLIGGGSGVEATSCSTECPDGTTVEITDCIGTCTAVDGKSVTCKGSATGKEIIKTCGY